MVCGENIAPSADYLVKLRDLQRVFRVKKEAFQSRIHEPGADLRDLRP